MKRYDLHYTFDNNDHLVSTDIVEDSNGSLVPYEYVMQQISELERELEFLKQDAA